jgi:hypothetical protein
MDDDAHQSAERTVTSEHAPWSKLRWASFYLFDSGHFDLARQGFKRLVALGHANDQIVTTLHQLYTDRGDFDAAARLIANYLVERGDRLTPREHLDWSTLHFDTLATDPTHPDRSTAALDLLQAASAAGPDGWKVVFDPSRQAAIEATLQDPAITLSVLEQFLYAPNESGLPSMALDQIEAFGCLHADNWDRARAAERLLHAAGHPDAAYRIESCRRDSHRPVRQPLAPAPPSPSHNITSVAIAGGHPALRSLARRDLATIGVTDVREIPSAWEATRDGRSVQATISGADLVVVITRQIAHTTSDQVRSAAARLSIPVVNAETASVAAIHRAVEHAAIAPEA